MEPYIYLRGLRHVDHSVFCVTEGQKFYYDPVFEINGYRIKMPYSSGQQVKRSILESISYKLNQQRSPVSFIWKAPGLEEGEVLSICDPQYYDQIFGGWMHTAQKNDKKKGNDEKTHDQGKSRTIKRRSPFSISAMRPLHPLLGGLESENMTFDRSDRPEIPNKIIVRNSEGVVLTQEEVNELLSGTDRSLLRKWLKPSNRASGLFIYDIAIDLRTLFSVSTNQLEPELTDEKIKELLKNGWIPSRNTFGECLVMPKILRDKAIPAISNALLSWRITSNQSRTFSLMETLAIAISDNANKLAGAIRAKLIEDGEKPKAKPIIDETAGADIYVTLPCSNYVVTSIESVDALEQAENKLIELMMSFDYENQV
ncbi:MAG: CRISPR-associated protein Cas7 [Lentimicrobiaceae bacterium]|nr:CRISPR-associated protein Cas7 [Lentimicrobiaceae bacterium]